MTEEEQANYLEWRSREAWRIAGEVTAFLTEHFVGEEREQAWHKWREVVAMRVRDVEIGEAAGQVPGVAH